MTKAKQTTTTEKFQPPDTCGQCKYSHDRWDDGAVTLVCKNTIALSHGERVMPRQLACRAFSTGTFYNEVSRK